MNTELLGEVLGIAGLAFCTVVAMVIGALLASWWRNRK